MNWKITLLKSILYRFITVILGLVTAYIVTGDFKTALGLSLATELIQSINYFGFESIWNYFYERKIREELSREFQQREIQIKLTTEMILDISKEFAEVDTFNPQLYQNLLKFFNTSLENKELKEFHEEIQVSKRYFEAVNQGRNFS